MKSWGSPRFQESDSTVPLFTPPSGSVTLLEVPKDLGLKVQAHALGAVETEGTLAHRQSRTHLAQCFRSKEHRVLRHFVQGHADRRSFSR